MTTIVFANPKGRVGESTVAALFTEWTAKLIDAIAGALRGSLVEY